MGIFFIIKRGGVSGMVLKIMLIQTPLSRDVFVYCAIIIYEFQSLCLMSDVTIDFLKEDIVFIKFIISLCFLWGAEILWRRYNYPPLR